MRLMMNSHVHMSYFSGLHESVTSHVWRAADRQNDGLQKGCGAFQ
jgi:hypothetical protein